MKRILLILSLLCLVASAQAQDYKRHELTFSVGLGGNGSTEASCFPNKAREMKKQYRNPSKHWEDRRFDDDLAISVSGSWAVDYYYNISKQVAAGMLVGQSVCSDRYNSYDPYNPYNELSMENANFDVSIWYVMPQFRYTWFLSDNGIVRLYSAAAAGLAFQKTTYDNAPGDLPQVIWHDRCFTYQTTAIGISLGGQFVRFNAEGGFGVRGIVNIGVKFLFK